MLESPNQNPFYELKKKVQKKHATFCEAVDGLSLEDLRKNMLMYAKYKEETLTAKENDEELKSAKAQVAELSGPYNDTLNALKLKISYIYALLAEQGDANQK
jgi:hypothetical protein